MGISLSDGLGVGLAERELLAEHATDQDFLTAVEGPAARPGSVILLSGGDGDCARYSLAGWDPFAILTSKGRQVTIQTAGGSHGRQADPLEALGRFLGWLRPDYGLEAEPFCGGALGYFAYELKNQIERLPQQAADDLGLPEMLLSLPSRILIHDRRSGALTRIRLEAKGLGPMRMAPAPPAGPPLLGKLGSNFSAPGYRQAVEAIREYILNGDVYQVNLSQRLFCDFQGEPFAFWRRLFALNPAPFYAYVNGGDHQVLSTSMERFLYARGRYIQTRPIKGTRGRNPDPERDQALAAELLQSPKDAAELAMIVDLLRNDLGRVCAPGSVRVAEHKRLEAYQNVYHLVSIIDGKLAPGIDWPQVLRATFPGGSITGCPKIRSMEIIDELEPQVRQVYTGAMGYLGWHGNLDLNIAIRTAIISQGLCRFSAGGGVVYDSVAQDEYQETLAKARTFLQAAGDTGKGSP